MSYYRNDSPEEDETDLASAWSVASTANDLVVQYGRRFPSYSYGSQHFPRGDALAIQNERALHALLLHLYRNRLFVSNVENPQNVLDVRAGHEGLWTKNMADAFPDAQITGIDTMTPSTEGQENLGYILQDYNDSWILDEVTQAHGRFDFIYARSLFGGSRNFPAFYEQCFEHMDAGGYFEQTEIVPMVQCDDDVDWGQSIVAQISLLGPLLSRITQTDYYLGDNVKAFLEQAGFVDVEEHIDTVPWSPWKSENEDPHDHQSGSLLLRFYETGIQGWMLQPCIKLGMSQEEVDAWCETAVSELRSNEYRWYSKNVTITARKPPV